MTLKELAKAAGVSMRQYQRIEAVERIPRVDVALRIAAALGKTVEELFGKGA